MGHNGLAALALFCLACGSAPPPANGISVSPASYDATTLTLAELSEGSAVDLVRPPQGGYVLFLAGRARGLSKPQVQLSAILRDTDGATVAMDSRALTLVPAPDDPSVLIPDLRSYTNVSNVTLCPSASANDHVDLPFDLELRVLELSTQRVGSTRIKVVPSCRQADAATKANCQCECRGGFVLGKCK